MSSATDALARARAELAAAEQMGVNTDPAQSAVEQAEQAVEDEGSSIRQVVLAELDQHGSTLTVLTDTQDVEVVDVRPLSGPGVWRRVLRELESRGVQDRDHIIPAWKYGLVGEWHY